ncbi:MAG TPA: cyclase family protein [Acidimicrobiia bacterium]|jgi:kynurenine formamidase
MRLIDLSHEIRDGLVTYPGIPAPTISEILSFDDSAARYAPGTEFQIASIQLAANTGTYLDTPAHRHREGFDLAGLALSSVAFLDGIVVDAPGGGGGPIGAAALAGLPLTGRAVLVRTGWSRRWGTDAYFSGHPHIDESCATALASAGAALVGIDSLNIDATDDGTRHAHTVLLAAGIPIVEHLTALEELPVDGFTFFAVPPRVAGMGTFPVRAFAMVPD